MFVLRKYGVLCFLETPVLRFALLRYYRRNYILFLLSYLDLHFTLDLSSEECTFSLTLACDYQELNQISLKSVYLFSKNLSHPFSVFIMPLLICD